MKNKFLLDVNMLLAIMDEDHVFHDIATNWFLGLKNAKWATCPITENGFVRIVCNKSYDSLLAGPAEAVQLLSEFKHNQKNHEFWEDSVSLTEDIFLPQFIRNHGEITDIYLLGLALKKGAKLATLDKKINTAAVNAKRYDIVEIISA